MRICLVVWFLHYSCRELTKCSFQDWSWPDRHGQPAHLSPSSSLFQQDANEPFVNQSNPAASQYQSQPQQQQQQWADPQFRTISTLPWGIGDSLWGPAASVASSASSGGFGIPAGDSSYSSFGPSGSFPDPSSPSGLRSGFGFGSQPHNSDTYSGGQGNTHGVDSSAALEPESPFNLSSSFFGDSTPSHAGFGHDPSRGSSFATDAVGWLRPLSESSSSAWTDGWMSQPRAPPSSGLSPRVFSGTPAATYGSFSATSNSFGTYDSRSSGGLSSTQPRRDDIFEGSSRALNPRSSRAAARGSELSADDSLFTPDMDGVFPSSHDD